MHDTYKERGWNWDVEGGNQDDENLQSGMHRRQWTCKYTSGHWKQIPANNMQALVAMDGGGNMVWGRVKTLVGGGVVHNSIFNLVVFGIINGKDKHAQENMNKQGTLSYRHIRQDGLDMHTHTQIWKVKFIYWVAQMALYVLLRGFRALLPIGLKRTK